MNELIIAEEEAENFMTVKALAEVLGVSERTIRDTEMCIRDSNPALGYYFDYLQKDD